jgi:hypothetical protein
MVAPETRFAKSGDVSIAYLVVGSNISFRYRGSQLLQGVPGEWQLFTVDGESPARGARASS